MAFAFYGDEARTDSESAIVTLAGYIGLYDDWLPFEEKATKVFADFGVNVLHGVDFYHRRKDFKGWSRTKQEDFAVAMQALLKGAATFAVTQSCVVADFKKVKREFKVAQQESPYGYCFRRIVGIILKDPVMRMSFDEIENADVSFILEQGCNNKGDVERIYEETKRISSMRGRLAALTFAAKDSTKSLQMADFFAYYSRRYLGTFDEKTGQNPGEPKIISILRDGVPIVDGVDHSFAPANKNAKKRS